MRDYWPRPGETIDLHRLDQDRTAAVEEIVIHESVDPSGVLHRHIRLKLRDKQRALDSLARHLGIFTDRRGAEGSLERQVMSMTPEERVACANELLEEAQKYLPQYEEWERPQGQQRTNNQWSRERFTLNDDALRRNGAGNEGLLIATSVPLLG